MSQHTMSAHIYMSPAGLAGTQRHQPRQPSRSTPWAPVVLHSTFSVDMIRIRLIMQCFHNASFDSVHGNYCEHTSDRHNVSGKFGAGVITFIICSGFIGNFLVITAVGTCAKLRKSYNALIASLAVNDLIFNLVIMPSYADTYLRREWIYSTWLCRFETFLGTILVITSSLHIAMIAFNRYVLIVHRNKYTRCFSRWSIALQIIFIWVISFLIVLPGILGWHAKVAYSDQIGRCNYVRSASKGSLYLIFGLGFIIPCGAILYCYLQISVVVLRSKQKLAAYKKSMARSRETRQSTGMRPRCQTMPEGKEVKRLAKEVKRQETMLNLLTTGHLLDSSPCVSSDDVACSRSLTSNNTINTLSENTEVNQSTVSKTTNMQKPSEGSQPEMEALLPIKEGTASQVIKPAITVTEDCSSVNDSHDKNHLNQSVISLDENKASHMNGSLHAQWISKRGKRHTIPADRHRTGKGGSRTFLQRLHLRHHSQHHFKSFKMILAVFLGFSLSYLPFTLLNFADDDSCLDRAWYMMTSLLFWSGSCINPWIYGVMNVQFREAYRNIICNSMAFMQKHTCQNKKRWFHPTFLLKCFNPMANHWPFKTFKPLESSVADKWIWPWAEICHDSRQDVLKAIPS